MIRSYKNFQESVEIKLKEMSFELAKEMFEYLESNGEHALVHKYKNIVSDTDISGIIGSWATSIKPLEEIISDYWNRKEKMLEAKFIDDDSFKSKNIQIVSTEQMRSGFMRSRESLSFVDAFYRGEAVVELQPNRYFTFDRRIKGNTLAKGMFVAASYNQYNQGIEFCEILGFTDIDKKYGEGGVKFNSVKEVFNHFKVSSLKALENVGEDLGYGHSVYLVVKDLETEESGPWFYLYEGRWSRGSGAEALSFVLLKEVYPLEEA